MESSYHTPVMLKECIEGLNIRPDGTYVDVTFGGGGHSKAIMSHLGKNGRLLAFDQDADARQNQIDDDRFEFIDQNFRYLKNFSRLHNAMPVNGILADLWCFFTFTSLTRPNGAFLFALTRSWICA